MVQAQVSQISTETLTNVAPQSSDSSLHKSTDAQASSLAVSWAKKYYRTVAANRKPRLKTALEGVDLTAFDGNRVRTVDRLMDSLKMAIDLGWSKVENLLGEEREHHAISPNLIDAKEIQIDARNIFRKTLDAFADYESPSRLSVLVGREIIQVRRKYSTADPLVLGFVSMQFYYVSEILLGCVSAEERVLLIPYLKGINDYLSTPLAEVHDAAANHPYNSSALRAVQHLLPNTTSIAHAVYERASGKNAGYRSKTGHLTDTIVKLSSVRDVEIFQSYLCLCALEGSVRPIQEELFPLCVMLYPKLHVSWKLVQEMLLVMFWEIHDRLPPEDVMVFLPYLRTLTEMFSDEVFQAV